MNNGVESTARENAPKKTPEQVVDELCERIRLTVALAETEQDGDGFVSAYHFKTGAIHRLLALANDPYNYEASPR